MMWVLWVLLAVACVFFSGALSWLVVDSIADFCEPVGGAGAAR
jgi:hypothetical protein